MVLLFGSMLASLSLIYDKESGVMRMLVIAPFPHYWIILARTASAVIVGVVQAIMLIVILAPFGYIASSINVPLLITGLLMTATVCAGMGMLIAVYSKTLENFAVIMNFVIFPVFFLSGALYPLQHLPAAIRTIALVNPFSYGVDLLKHAMMDNLQAGYQADFSISVDLTVMLLFSLIAVGISCMRFSQTPVMEKLAKVLSNPKRI
jgi:ABC-2 type transport system permease protein